MSCVKKPASAEAPFLALHRPSRLPSGPCWASGGSGFELGGTQELLPSRSHPAGSVRFAVFLPSSVRKGQQQKYCLLRSPRGLASLIGRGWTRHEHVDICRNLFSRCLRQPGGLWTSPLTPSAPPPAQLWRSRLGMRGVSGRHPQPSKQPVCFCRVQLGAGFWTAPVTPSALWPALESLPPL